MTNKTKDDELNKYPVVVLKKGEEERALKGHPWIFDNEIATIPAGTEDGSIVTVVSSADGYVGTGYINTKSKITIRLLHIGAKNEKPKEINLDSLLKLRVTTALKKREGIKDTDAKRLIFSEADMLPGFIADIYKHTLVIQVTTLGMEKLKWRIIGLLDDALAPECIYEKSISASREKEGLTPQEGVIKPIEGKVTPTMIKENGLKFLVDFESGTKTGFYLDQREARLRLKRYSKNSRVLDCFCYTGAFGVYAMACGAKAVTGIDINEKAIQTAAANMRLNHFDKFEFIKADAFDALRDLSERGEKYRLIILDPPPFSKAKDEKGGAKKGYRELHLQALKLVEEGGHIFTFSCSRNISVNDLKKSIYGAAKDLKCKVEVIDHLKQAPDHPVVAAIPETEYLKGLIVRKLKPKV